MSNFCQVIKPNGRSCCNYSRKNKECCYSHRSLESGEIVLEKPKIKHLIQGTPDKCYVDLCKIIPDFLLDSKNKQRYCCWKHHH